VHRSVHFAKKVPVPVHDCPPRGLFFVIEPPSLGHASQHIG